jgi:glutathione peroxidase
MTNTKPTDSLYRISVKNIEGLDTTLEQFRGQVLLIVNVASRCGFTSQYEGLESLYSRYHAEGFSVLGFPCNQFGAQEPGDEAEIKSFCSLTYKVTFPMFAKIDVNGETAAPLYQFLKANGPGILGTEAIKWNFTKFLVDKHGETIERFAPSTSPESLRPRIEELLKAP